MFQKLTVLSLLVLASAHSLQAADHKEAPLVRDDATIDINDVYFFQSPSNPNNVVMAMTVNPFTFPAQNRNAVFSNTARYVFNISNDADSDTEHQYIVTFTGSSSGSAQPMRVQLNGVDVITSSNPTSTPPSIQVTPNAPLEVTGSNGERIFAGQTDDPFFFDFTGFQRFLANPALGFGAFSGRDAFAGVNVSTIVIEVPASVLAVGNNAVTNPNLQMWGSTERRRVTVRRSINGQFELNRGEWEQVERMGVPAVSTVFISGPRKNEYNYVTPKEDEAGLFLADITATFAFLGTNSTNQGIIASVALPDTLKLNAGSSGGFPNGRRPQDDVIDTLLQIVFNDPGFPSTPTISDGANLNDKPFPATFPYFSEPHQPL